MAVRPLFNEMAAFLKKKKSGHAATYSKFFQKRPCGRMANGLPPILLPFSELYHHFAEMSKVPRAAVFGRFDFNQKEGRCPNPHLNPSHEATNEQEEVGAV